MSTRLTDTEKWDDPWFRGLPLWAKCAWIFLCDRCDNAGVWKKDFALMRFYIGEDISEKDIFLALNSDKKRVIDLPQGKWLIKDFASFHWKNNPMMYKNVNKLCQKHGIDFKTLLIEYRDPIHRAKDKGKDKVKGKTKDGIRRFDPQVCDLISKTAKEIGGPGARRIAKN